jgi:hypothetical protein
MMEGLVAAGVADDEAIEQAVERLGVSSRSARKYLAWAYEEMAKAAEVDRRQLVGVALKRRRIAAARALRDGDTRAYLAAADSESRLLGLDAPARLQHTVLVEQIAGATKAMTESVREFFENDPAGRQKFVSILRARVNAELATRPEKIALVIDVSGEVKGESVEASDARSLGPTTGVSPTTAPAPDAPPPA